MKTINYTGSLFKGFSRLNNFPLDESNVFLDIESLENYLTESEDKPNTIAYPGQIVAVLSESAVYLIKSVKKINETEKNIKDCYEKFSTIQEIHTISREVVDERLQALFNDGDLDLKNYAKKEYVEAEIQKLINGAPEALDTLKEISDVLNQEDGATAAILTTISNKVDRSELEDYVGTISLLLERRLNGEL